MSLFVLGTFCISLVAGNTGENEVFTSEVGPRLIPETEMPHSFETIGKLPEFKNKVEEQKWLEKLAELGDRLDGPDVPFVSEGIVVGHGAGGDGYYWVTISPDKKNEANKAVMTTIVTTIDKVAKEEIGFDREVPVKFAWVTGATGWEAYDSRTIPYRPIIGGIQVQSRDQGVTMPSSTLGWSAVRSGVKGYVVASHIGYNRLIPIGSTIYQPTYPSYPAGTVRDRKHVYADAAWVEFSNVIAKIYLTPGLIVSVNFYQDPSVGSTVYMSGLASGLVNGTVRYINVDEQLPLGWLYDQAIASYPRASGDSGAPVYIPTQYGRGIVGIHSGASVNFSGLARFSPTSGVNTDVGAVPLTTWP